MHFCDQDFDSPFIFPCKSVIRETSSQLIESLVDFLEDRLKKRLSSLYTKPLGLATGRTMEPVYSRLVSRLISWPSDSLFQLVNCWSSFNLDEYIGLEQGDNRSYFSYIKLHLGDKLNIRSNRFNSPKSISENPIQEALDYSNKLSKYGGISVQLLGLGNNGHVGFNEPPCSPSDGCRVVNLSEETRKQNIFSFGNNLNKVPMQAITLGLKEILLADEIHLVVIGKNKANILRSLLSSGPTDNLPASWLGTHHDLYLWADYAALGKSI